MMMMMMVDLVVVVVVVMMMVVVMYGWRAMKLIVMMVNYAGISLARSGRSTDHKFAGNSKMTTSWR